MASSTMGVYENRAGIDLLYSSHTGLSANLAEIFYFPTGRWDVLQISFVIHGDSTVLMKGIDGATGTTYYYMSVQPWQYTASGEPIQAHPQLSSIAYRDGGTNKQTSIHGKNDLVYERGDYLTVFGPDIGTDDTVYCYVTARRLQ